MWCLCSSDWQVFGLQRAHFQCIPLPSIEAAMRIARIKPRKRPAIVAALQICQDEARSILNKH